MNENQELYGELVDLEALNLPAGVRARMTDRQRAIMGETDPDKIHDFMAAGTAMIIEGIDNMIVGYLRLIQLGHAPSEIVAPLPYFRQMAYGTVLPELVVNVGSRSRLLAIAAALPPPDQQSIADNQPVKVMETSGDFRMVPVMDLTSKQISQVFGDRGIRNEAEQAQYLSDLRKGQDLGTIEDQPVRIVGKKLYVDRPVVLSRKDLEMYLREMTK